MTAETLTAEERFDQVVTGLGTLEVRGSMQRVYIDDLMGWLQLEIERDEDGKPVSATRGGQPLDLKNAIRIENQLKRARLYYDLNDRVFRGQGLDSINKGDLSKNITRHVEKLIAEGDAGAGEDQHEADTETEAETA